MVVLNNEEPDIMQLWGVITQLGEQLSQNQAMSVSLYTTAGKIKVGCIVVQPGRSMTLLSCRTRLATYRAASFYGGKPLYRILTHVAHARASPHRFNLDKSQGSSPSSLKKSESNILT